ncbi:alpha/beta fold hydrolase [Desulfoluna spongiiphila]|nr:alpha/beta hydrolase [Desulfoluna spongiiphila]
MRLPENATWKHHGGSGLTAHFYGANGFPAGVYSPLVTRLADQMNLFSLDLRPSWPDIGKPPASRDWTLYADDLIAFLENTVEAPVIGIGHSMGATCTILAAAKRPDLFKALVLIEPAMLSRPLAFLAGILPKAAMNLTQPAKGTLKKTDAWESRGAYLAHCRRMRMFSRLGEDAFEAMAAHGVRETGDGRVELVFPKVWEAHNYTQPPNVMGTLHGIKLPCVALRARPSVFFTEALWQEWQRLSPETVFMEDLSAGHLLPLEDPEGCCGLISSGIATLRHLL